MQSSPAREMRASAAERELGRKPGQVWRFTRRHKERPLACGIRIANGDLAVSQDVGVEPAAVDEFPDDPRPGHLLQMQARLCLCCSAAHRRRRMRNCWCCGTRSPSCAALSPGPGWTGPTAL